MCDKALFRRIIVVMGVLVCFSHTVVFALYDTAPSWRGLPGSTYAIWEFGSPGTELPSGDYWYSTPDSGGNNYGTPTLMVTPVSGSGWLSALGPASGVWALSGQITAKVPNTSVTGEGTSKWVQIQLVWKSETNSSVVPSITVDAGLGNCYYTAEGDFTVTNTSLSDGWTYGVYYVELLPNPKKEIVYVSGSIYADSLIIDTICIPEPATLGIMGVGAVVLYLLRKVK